MKVKITFELDLKDTHYDIPRIGLIPVCLMNLGQWFHELHLHHLHKKFDFLAEKNSHSPEVVKAIRQHNDQNLMLSEQLFHNYKVEGTTIDGHTFEFTHKEPGYREVTKVDGSEIYIDPCEE